MRNVISYSLYASPRRCVDYYVRGAFRAIDANARLFPGWEVQFHVSSDIRAAYGASLADLGGTVIDHGETPDHRGAFWRFLSLEDATIDTVLFRDCDCRATSREHHLVDLWLATTKIVHVIRDLPKHRHAVMAGLWGVRHPPDELRLALVQELRTRLTQTNRWGDDERWLAERIFPLIQDVTLEHDSQRDASPFLPELDGYRVGQSEDP